MSFVDHRLLPEGARCDPIRNVSTARTSDARQNASQWPHHYSPALETTTLLAPGPRTRTWTIASAVAVIAHLLEHLVDPGTQSAGRIVMGAAVAIRQLCESAERRKLAWEATRRLYQSRQLVADLPKLVVNDPVGLADDAPTGPEALMWAPRELGIERDDQMLQRRAQ